MRCASQCVGSSTHEHHHSRRVLPMPADAAGFRLREASPRKGAFSVRQPRPVGVDNCLQFNPSCGHHAAGSLDPTCL